MTTHKKPKASANAATPAPITPDSKPAAVIAHLKAKYPLSADDIEAFDALITDAKRSELGKKTKASKVLENGCRWAVEVDKQLDLYPAALADYFAQPARSRRRQRKRRHPSHLFQQQTGLLSRRRPDSSRSDTLQPPSARKATPSAREAPLSARKATLAPRKAAPAARKAAPAARQVLSASSVLRRVGSLER